MSHGHSKRIMRIFRKTYIPLKGKVSLMGILHIVNLRLSLHFDRMRIHQNVMKKNQEQSCSAGSQLSLQQC